MNQETKKLRELKYVCPKCGANSLRAEASGYLDIDRVYDVASLHGILFQQGARSLSHELQTDPKTAQGYIAHSGPSTWWPKITWTISWRG